MCWPCLCSAEVMHGHNNGRISVWTAVHDIINAQIFTLSRKILVQLEWQYECHGGCHGLTVTVYTSWLVPLPESWKLAIRFRKLLSFCVYRIDSSKHQNAFQIEAYICWRQYFDRCVSHQRTETITEKNLAQTTFGKHSDSERGPYYCRYPHLIAALWQHLYTCSSR